MPYFKKALYNSKQTHYIDDTLVVLDITNDNLAVNLTDKRVKLTIKARIVLGQIDSRIGFVSHV